MGVTVIVNKMTAAHSSSQGKSIAFPDVCKTPAPPAGPIPIPYPNIAMTSDATSEAKKVKFDQGKLMGKGSKIKMSSGDEAGSAQGVASNKIKGKAEFILYSFDVKANGKNVCRLADPMKQNMGSTPNGAGPALLQAFKSANPVNAEYCEKVKEKKEEQQGDETSWGKSGVWGPHQSAFQQVATDRKLIIYIRGSNEFCVSNGWIPGGHRPKPHAVFFASTIAPDKLDWVIEWYFETWLKLNTGQKTMESMDAEEIAAYGLVAGCNGYVEPLMGIVLKNVPGDELHGMPLLASERYGKIQDSVPPGYAYPGKWITGDYDLLDIMSVAEDCERPNQNSNAFKQLQKELNSAMGWGGIQHGPQVQWAPRKSKNEPANLNFQTRLTNWLKSDLPAPPQFSVGIRTFCCSDDNVTAVYPGGAVYLKEHKDVKDALLCKGCAQPKQKKRSKYE